MTFRRLLIVLVAVAMVLGVSAGLASASQPYADCGWGGGACYPFYSLYGREHIPYFALHPPVYYSYPLPRTYGYSPFAYPFGSPTPEIEFEAPKPAKKPEPKTMLNPHVKDVSHVEQSA